MKKLQVLLDLLTKGRKIHISVLDVRGILNGEKTKIDFKNVIHSKRFCDVAKSTDMGYSLCLFCKKCSNNKAIKEKKAFVGHCPYGLYEAAIPVVIDNQTAAVVYVGNAIVDIDITSSRIDRTCEFTKANKEALLSEANECERIESYEDLLDVGEIVCDYIKALYKEKAKEKSSEHWLVLAAKRHANEEYSRNPTLKEISSMYQKNEKYVGRIFQRDMGMSFHRYSLLLKLKKAASLLVESDSKIIDIALECGFNSISYFNRSFKKEYGISPKEYRACEKSR